MAMLCARYGIGLLVTWSICVICGAIAVTSHNKKLIAGATLY